MRLTKTIKQLKKKADKVLSEYIRKKDADENGLVRCFTCGTVKLIREIQDGHFMSRKHNMTRYNLFNNQPQCKACNIFNYGKQWLFGQKLNKRYGKGTAEAIELKSRENHEFTTTELEGIIAGINLKLSELKGGK